MSTPNGREMALLVSTRCNFFEIIDGSKEVSASTYLQKLYHVMERYSLRSLTARSRSHISEVCAEEAQPARWHDMSIIIRLTAGFLSVDMCGTQVERHDITT
jgi:hypothetical protein